MSAIRAGVFVAIALPLLGLVPATDACRAGNGESSAGDASESISWTWSTIVARPGEPRGYATFQRDCAVCHGTGPAKPGTRALAVKYQGKLPALLEQRTDLQAGYIEYIVRHGVSVMPPFRKTELSDADLDVIVAYLTRKR